jgi:hypothetical protein
MNTLRPTRLTPSPAGDHHRSPRNTHSRPWERAGVRVFALPRPLDPHPNPLPDATTPFTRSTLTVASGRGDRRPSS